MPVRSKSIKLTTDASGDASGSFGVSPTMLIAVQIVETAATGGTLDVENLGRKILDSINPSTAAMHNIREIPTEADGSAIVNSHVYPVISGIVDFTVAGAGATKDITVALHYKD